MLGKFARLVREMVSSPTDRAKRETSDLLLDHARVTYQDQKGQVDSLIINEFYHTRNGLQWNGNLVDLACTDGITKNKTYFLKEYLGWHGLLFEPNPVF